MILKDTEMGKLKAVVVYDWYNGPLSYTSENEHGQRFYAHWVDGSPAHDTYYFAAITKERQLMLEARKLSIRDALLEPDGGAVWEVTFAKHGPDLARKLDVSDLNHSYLPEPDAKLITGKY